MPWAHFHQKNATLYANVSDKIFQEKVAIADTINVSEMRCN